VPIIKYLVQKEYVFLSTCVLQVLLLHLIILNVKNVEMDVTCVITTKNVKYVKMDSS
jgi:hypothetical protein